MQLTEHVKSRDGRLAMRHSIELAHCQTGQGGALKECSALCAQSGRERKQDRIGACDDYIGKLGALGKDSHVLLPQSTSRGKSHLRTLASAGNMSRCAARRPALATQAGATMCGTVRRQTTRTEGRCSLSARWALPMESAKSLHTFTSHQCA
jgi:hypothetical protein